MTAFFVCIILIGVLMIAVAMVWMVVEKKNLRDYRLEVDERRYELHQVIEDAEQLLDELNHFSDYIVTRMEEKQQDVEAVIKSADERLNLFEQITQLEMPDTENEKLEAEYKNVLDEDPKACQAIAGKAKIIPFDEKRRQVIKLCKDGMNSTEIARLLNMGKGEIELISKMVH
ncbi:MAG: hypothetical protein GX144_03885 [Clostridiaceae bacterium]|nr:hypothetical protein [Clostridiaceae bacterium]